LLSVAENPTFLSLLTYTWREKSLEIALIFWKVDNYSMGKSKNLGSKNITIVSILPAVYSKGDS